MRLYLISPRTGSVVHCVTTEHQDGLRRTRELFGDDYEVTETPTQQQLDAYERWLTETAETRSS